MVYRQSFQRSRRWGERGQSLSAIDKTAQIYRGYRTALYDSKLGDYRFGDAVLLRGISAAWFE